MGATRGWLVAIATVGTLILAVPAGAGEEPGAYQRAYLLADEGGFTWWSFDPLEPDADARTVHRQCPTTPGHIAGGQQCHPYTWFNPRSRLAEPLGWSDAQPLRFRLALEIETLLAPTVRLVVARNRTSALSPPAVEVAPGVWEGQLTTGEPVAPGDFLQFAVRVETPDVEQVRTRLRTDGTSFVEFPAPIRGWSLSDLVRASPPVTDPEPLVTDTKTFWFADADWAVTAYDGDLGAPRTHPHLTERPAAALVVWLEVFRDPLVYRALRHGEVDPEAVLTRATLHVHRDGEQVATGSGVHDGMDTASAVGVAAGNLDIMVWPEAVLGDPPNYRLYVLEVHGERTLHRMRSTFSPFVAARTPWVSACNDVSQPVPLTPAVTAFRVDLDWDAVVPGQRWSPSYRLAGLEFPCSEEGSGNAITFVPPAPLADGGVFWIGATPARGTPFASHRDVLVDAEVRFHYSPPPAAGQEP